jgi:hypothetical protein
VVFKNNHWVLTPIISLIFSHLLYKFDWCQEKIRVLNEDIEDHHLSVYFSFLLLGLFNVRKLKQNGFTTLWVWRRKESEKIDFTGEIQVTHHKSLLLLEFPHNVSLNIFKDEYIQTTGGGGRSEIRMIN